MSRLIKQFAIASLLLTFAAPAANANFVDSFFSDLFGPMGGGPRQTIKLKPGAYTPGEIVVSFGDRRLYFIELKTTAISYSIAIPKAEAKWSGVSYVSQKRENPVWTPTPDMRKGKSGFPPMWPRRSTQSARHTRDVPGRLHVPHTRHGRGISDRRASFARLHPHV